MKQTILILVLAISVMEAQSQRLVFVFGHAGYASPVGKLRNNNRAGASVELGAGLGLGNTFLTATTGYTWLFVNRDGTTSGGLRYTPYTLGLRRTILLNKIFFKVDAGLATMKYVDTENRSSHLTTSVGAGIKLLRWELLADYNSVGNYGSWIGFKGGFNIGL